MAPAKVVSQSRTRRPFEKAEIEGVNFRYADIGETIDRYQPDKCKQGWNTTADGERISSFRRHPPALWATREKLFNRPSGFAE